LPFIIHRFQLPSCVVIQPTIASQTPASTRDATRGRSDTHAWQVFRSASGLDHIITPDMWRTEDCARIHATISEHHCGLTGRSLPSPWEPDTHAWQAV
jgi:hypothetical protein